MLNGKFIVSLRGWTLKRHLSGHAVKASWIPADVLSSAREDFFNYRRHSETVRLIPILHLKCNPDKERGLINSIFPVYQLEASVHSHLNVVCIRVDSAEKNSTGPQAGTSLFV